MMLKRQPSLFGTSSNLLGGRAVGRDRTYVPPAAKAIVYAIRAIGRPATEKEIIEQCARMRRDGMTGFNLGTNTNLRNRIYRNWSESSIYYKDGWAAKGYADIFLRIKRVGQLTRWWVADWYKP